MVAAWVIVLGGLLAAWPLWNERGEPEALEPGGVIQQDLTLVPADGSRLDCGLDRDVGGYRCRFNTRLVRRSVPPADQLAPYVSVKGRLFLVGALFQEERVRAHAKARGLGATAPRFTARCEMRVLERIDRVRVRFGPIARWTWSEGVWVVEPIRCDVVE